MIEEKQRDQEIISNERLAKILFVTPFSWLYGEALSLLQLATSLDPKQYGIKVITTGEGPLVGKLQEAEIPVHSIQMPYVSRRGKQAVDFASSLLPTSIQIARFIKDEGFDLVYNNTLLNPYGAVAAKMAGVPCIWHVREVGRGSSIRNMFLKITARLATRLVVVSHSVAGLYDEEVRDKIRVVYNGIDPNHFDPALFDAVEERWVYGIPPEAPVISVVGRLHASKHHEDVLTALKDLTREWPDCRLIIAGDGPLEEELKQKVSDQKLENNVIFAGYIADVRPVLAASDVMVMPSEHEAFGRAVAEAMLMGKPVIATNVGGLPELISPETGYLVPVGCPDDIRDALREIFRNPARSKAMGRSGRQRAEQNFSLNRYVEEMKAVFEELL